MSRKRCAYPLHTQHDCTCPCHIASAEGPLCWVTVRQGMDTPAKRAAALRYLRTLEGMTADDVLLDRIARLRMELGL